MTTYLLDATSYNSGGRPFGIGQYAYHLALAFNRIRGELAPDERLLAAVRLRGPGAVTDDLRIDRHADPMPPRRGVYNRGRRRYFRRTLQQAGADLVHFVEGTKVMSVMDLPVVVTCHDLIPLLDPEHYLTGPCERFTRRFQDYWSYHRARRVIADSQTTARVLVEHLSLPPARIDVVALGVDHDHFHPAALPGEHDDIRREHGLPSRYAVYVGATDWRKRVDLLIGAYQQVFRVTGVPLALVGADFSPVRHTRIKRALRAASSGSIVLVGEVRPAHMPCVYRQAELHVLPSVYEGFGLTVLEAMACGCPVVATTGGAVPEVAGDAALLVEPDDWPRLVQALIDLLRNAAARDRLRVRGLERASSFTWERTARETLALYRRATGRVVSPSGAGVHEHATGEHWQQP
jgi:glycosyltransferase involved in cell wall biosynthesis